MEDKKSYKQLLRKQIIGERKTFDEYAYQYANNKIYTNVLEVINSTCPDINKSKNEYNIGLYWPLKGEPDLLKIAIIAGNYIGLPKISGSQMIFTKYYPGDQIIESLIPGLYQPISTLEVRPNIIILPSLALSLSGYRLGFGCGYYDRYLNQFKSSNSVITIGVCFHKWLMEYLPYDKFDYRLDYIITDQHMIKI